MIKGLGTRLLCSVVSAHLPVAEVEKAPDVLLFVEGFGLVLHFSDDVHLLVVLEHFFPRQLHLLGGKALQLVSLVALILPLHVHE